MPFLTCVPLIILSSGRRTSPHGDITFTHQKAIRPLITILFGGLGLWLRVGILGVVRVWVRVRVSIRVRLGGSVSKGLGSGSLWG